MNKKEFLEKLEKELVHNRCTDVKNILEYYDELIEDKKESGVALKDIIKNLDINEIVKNVRVEQRIDEAVKKPTVSNGIKALIATLSILSIPLLIPIGAVVFAIVVTVLALLFALVVTVGAIIFAGGVSIVAFIAAIFTGELPIATSIFSLGIILVVLGLLSNLFKWVVKIAKEFISWFAGFLKTKFNKRKEIKSNE